MLGQGAIAKRIRIGEVRELTQEDLPRLREKRGGTSVVQKFRDSHRRLAWLFATGMRPEQVAQATGYSLSRVYTLHPTPAFQQLIAELREKVEDHRAEVLDNFQDDVEAYKKLVFEGMIKAQRQLVDRLDDADEEETPLAPRELVAISHGSHELLYGKKNTNVNINVDFAAQLDRAIARSGKVINVTPSGPPHVVSQGAAHLPSRSAASPKRVPGFEQPLIRRRAV